MYIFERITIIIRNILHFFISYFRKAFLHWIFIWFVLLFYNFKLFKSKSWCYLYTFFCKYCENVELALMKILAVIFQIGCEYNTEFKCASFVTEDNQKYETNLLFNQALCLLLHTKKGLIFNPLTLNFKIYFLSVNCK